MQRFLNESFHLLNAMRRSATKILIFMLFVFITAIILGSVIYMFESSKNPAMKSIPTAIYWAVVTITTVGYGDITPVTPMGQFISTLVMLLGYSIIAVPTGIVVGETVREYRNDAPQGSDNEVPEEFNEYEEHSVAVVQEEPVAEVGQSGSESAAEPESTEALPAREVRYCPHCGHEEADEAARFCRYCGTLLDKNKPSGWINDFFKG